MARKKSTDGIDGVISLAYRAQPARLRKKALQRATRARGFGRPVDLPANPQVGPGADQRRNDCGPACVRMALDHLGLAPGVAIDALSLQIDPEDTGTNWDELVVLARAHGADAFVVNVGADQLPEPPAILLVRYCGFARETVQDKRYWDLSAQDPAVFHWAWWLGNSTVDGRAISVWNDPLYYRQRRAKTYCTPRRAGARLRARMSAIRGAVKFTGVFNAPSSGATLSVAPRDSDGVNFRTSPEIASRQSDPHALPAGTLLTVLEDADGALVKINSGQARTHWLRAQTQDGRDRLCGGLAGAAVCHTGQPRHHCNETVVARGAAALHNAPNGAVIWGVADGVPLRVLSSNGPDWPARWAMNWLGSRSRAMRLSAAFVRADRVVLPPAPDARAPVDDSQRSSLATAPGCMASTMISARGVATCFPPTNAAGCCFTEEVGGQGSSPFQSWAAEPGWVWRAGAAQQRLQRRLPRTRHNSWPSWI